MWVEADRGALHKREQVAEKILQLIRTGEQRAELAPEQLGGTFRESDT